MKKLARLTGIGALALAGCAGAAGGPHGFDFSTHLIDPDQVRRGGPPKDGIPALTDPDVLPAGEAGHVSPDDRVIGVQFNGEARGYPISILTWHEAVNDTLGGRPLVVTYCPLCRSSLVFDRSIGGQVREFGISGLLYQSNVLLYDRQSNPEAESLWSQVGMRAVTGPAARRGLELNLLPSELTTWQDWRSRHPDTTVLSPDTGHARPYDRNPYEDYFASDRLLFPVENTGTRRSDLAPKDLVAILGAGAEARAVALRDVREAAGPEGRARLDRGLLVELTAGGHGLRALPRAGASPPPTAILYHFVFDALAPDMPWASPSPVSDAKETSP